MISTRMIVLFLFYITVSALKVNVSLEPTEDLKNGKTYALLVVGGIRYSYGYRLEANVAAAYALLKKNGIPAENIVVMSYDFAIHQKENPCQGQLFHSPAFIDVYDPEHIDYKGLSVNPANVLSVLRGDSAAVKGGNGRVINSTSSDRIFLYFAAEGLDIPAAVTFQDETRMWAKDFVKTLQWMKKNDKYSEMVIYLDSDYGNRFLTEVPNNLSVYSVTNTNDLVDRNLTLATYCDYEHCGGVIPCMGTDFSVDFQDLTSKSDLYKTTLRRQVESIRELSEDYEGVLLEYGDLSISKRPIGCFMGKGNNKLCR